MRRPRPSLPPRVLVLFLVSFPLGAEGGLLRGRLLVDEKPAAGARVAAVPYETPETAARREAERAAAASHGKPLATAASLADGTFALTVHGAPGTPPVQFQVRVEGGGSLSVLLPGVFESSETEDLGDVALPGGPARLSGAVANAAGEPVAGARVTLVPAVGRSEELRELTAIPETVETSPDGTFAFSAASQAGNVVSVEAQGFAAWRATGVKAGTLPRPIVLARGLSLAGTVQKSDRKSPAGNALVRFEGKAITRWVATDAEGHFRLTDLPEGTGTLVAEAGEDGYAAVRGVSAAATPAAAAGVAVVLVPPAGLEGRVVDARSGKVVARAKVLVEGGGAIRHTRSGPDGRYRLHPLPSRSFSLRADEARFVPYRREGLTLSRGETRKVDIPLTPGSTLSGRVVDEAGAPVPGAKGQLVRGGQSPLVGFLRDMGESGPAIRTRADGSFVASRLEPGEGQRLTVTCAGFEKTTVGGLSLQPFGEKANVVVRMPRGLALAGLVRDADGAPLGGAEVSLSQSRTVRGGRGGAVVQLNVAASGRDLPKATTGPDGRFQVRGIGPGEYALRVAKAGYATETVDPVKVVEKEAPRPLEITLGPGASISGVVRRRGGGGAEGFVVVVRGARLALPPSPGENPLTGPDGLFTIEGLKVGEAYDLQAFGGALGLGPSVKKVVAPAADVEITVAGTGRITGRALDAATGQPVPEFEVSYEPDRSGSGMGIVMRRGARAAGRLLGGAAEKKLVQAEDGAFAIEDVPAGTWQVSVTAKGYQESHVGGVTVEEGASRDGVEVKLALGLALKGRAVDGKSGRGVPGASVSSSAAGTQGPMALLSVLGDAEGTETTDADGRFELQGLAPGKYALRVTHPDYAEANQTVELKDGLAPVDVQLGKGGALGGAVVNEVRQPAAGAEVTLTPAGEGGFGRGLLAAGAQTATTDDSGRFRFDRLTAGRYTLMAALRGKSSSPASAVLTADESREDLLLALSAGATVRGSVTGLGDQEKAGVSIMATGAEGFNGSTRTGADGRFEIDGVPAGTVSLRAQVGDPVSGTKAAVKSVTVADGQADAEVEIVFEPGGTLTGRVTRSGRPLPDAFVQANVAGGGGGVVMGGLGMNRTDDSGLYRIDGLKDGTYNVVAMGGLGTGGRATRTVKVQGDATLDLELPSLVLSGTVVEAGNRQPVPDANVEAASTDANRRTMSGATTDSNGSFSFRDLEAGPYRLTARKSGFQPGTKDVSVTDDGSGGDVTFELQRGDGLLLEGRDGIYGVPLHGLSVRVTAGGSNSYTGSVSLDGQGRGEVPSLAPGTYTVVAEASGYAALTFQGVNAPSSTPLSVALTPGGSVEIRPGPATLAIGSATAVLRNAAGLPHAYSAFGPDGRVVIPGASRRIAHLAPGAYSLAVDGGATKSFSVTEGGATLVELP